MGRRGLAWVLVLALVASVAAVLVWLAVEGFFRDPDWPLVLVGIGLGLGLMPVVGLLVRQRHRAIVVLWCRRFGPMDTDAGDRNQWMRAVIAAASRNFAYLVTLQDLSVQGAQKVARSIQVPVTVLGIVLGIFLFLSLMLWLDDLVENRVLNAILIGGGGIILYIAMFVAVGRLEDWITVAFASVASDPDRVRKRLEAIKRRRWAWQEMQVVRCRDADWKPHVEAILQVTDLAIIDGTESTRHLEWEVELAQRCVGARNVLLLLPEGSVPSEPATIDRLAYDAGRAQREIERQVSRRDDDDFDEQDLHLGPYGEEMAGRLRSWIESRKEGAAPLEPQADEEERYPPRTQRPG
jgi:hypothetical protein